jgi:hypothetical protein
MPALEALEAEGWPRCRLCGRPLDPERPLVQEVDAWTRQTSHACLDCYAVSGVVLLFDGDAASTSPARGTSSPGAGAMVAEQESPFACADAASAAAIE